MRHPATFIILVVFVALSVLIGCGGNASPAPSTATPAPTPTTPTTPTTPPGGTGTGGGGSTSGTTQWTSSVDTGTGTVSVSTAGDVTVQVSGEKASTSFTVNFCQWPGSDYNVRGLDSCFALNQTLMTDAIGNGHLTFHFPQPGMWAGAFFFAPGGDMSFSQARITTNALGSNGTMSGSLLPASKINQGRVPASVPTGSAQEPGSGTVALSGGKVTVTLKDATPNTVYSLGEFFSDAGSASQNLGNFTTDASGNATTIMTTAAGSGSIFSVYRINPTDYGFVTGFTVP